MRLWVWGLGLGLTGGCAERVIEMELVQGAGCVTYTPARGVASAGAWINDTPAALRVRWTWLDNPERRRDWIVELEQGGVRSDLDLQADRDGALTFDLDGPEDWSAGFRQPRDDNAVHWVRMRSVDPEEAAVLCMGHRDVGGEAQVLRRGTRATFEVLAHRADGLDARVDIVAVDFRNLLQDIESTLATSIVPVVDGRAAMTWEVPPGFGPISDRIEARVQLFDGDAAVGESEWLEVSVGG